MLHEGSARVPNALGSLISTAFTKDSPGHESVQGGIRIWRSVTPVRVIVYFMVFVYFGTLVVACGGAPLATGEILYAEGNLTKTNLRPVVSLIDLQSGNTRMLGVIEKRFDLSSDGTKIAFSRSGDIYVMDVTTGDEQNLTNGSVGPVSGPVWSPDGTMLYFQSQNCATPTGAVVYVTRADGSDLRVLFQSPGCSRTRVAPIMWSTDSKALWTKRGEWWDVIQLWRTDMAGRSGPPFLKFRSLPEGIDGRKSLSFFTKGNRAFVVITDKGLMAGNKVIERGETEPWSLAEDGGDPKLLFKLSYFCGISDFTSDFSRVATVCRETIRYPDRICLVDLDGENFKCITDDGNYLAPTFSPDGRHLAYIERHEVEDKNLSDIFVVDTKGKNRRRVTYFQIDLKGKELQSEFGRYFGVTQYAWIPLLQEIP